MKGLEFKSSRSMPMASRLVSLHDLIIHTYLHSVAVV